MHGRRWHAHALGRISRLCTDQVNGSFWPKKVRLSIRNRSGRSLSKRQIYNDHTDLYYTAWYVTAEAVLLHLLWFANFVPTNSGQRVLAGAASRSCLRAFATQPTTTTSTVAEPSSEEIPAALTAALSYAKKRADDAALKAEIAKVPGNYKQFRHIGRHTSNIGSRVASRYDPNDVLNNPPDDVTLEMLMAAQAHMGHNTSLWNPANSRYIYGIRDGIHIISLETTAAYLRRAARVVEEVAYRGGLILFAGTRKGQKQIVVRAAQLVSGCHVFQKWMPGAITNRDQILEGRQLRMLNKLDCEADGYEDHMLDRRPVMPDLVVCLNPTENYTLLYECGLENIPTIGIMDTDADPTWVTYQIPANDDR